MYVGTRSAIFGTRRPIFLAALFGLLLKPFHVTFQTDNSTKMSGIYPKLDSPSANVKKTVDANTNEPVQVSSAQVPDYKDPPGPLQKRECRDILFLILFILFWAGMAVISVLAIRNGNLDRYSLTPSSITEYPQSTHFFTQT